MLFRKNLGGKLGFILTQNLKLEFMSDIAKLSQDYLVEKFGEKTGYNHAFELNSIYKLNFVSVNGCIK